MERWAKYKSTIINVAQVKTFDVRKANKDSFSYENASKSKPWILSADHTNIDSFASKDMALQAAENIISGKHDIKM
jgi:hypothetical protein